MTDTTTIQETKVLWDKTADRLYVWDNDSGAWELFFVAADLVTNDALTADLALKLNVAGDMMTGNLQVPGIGIGTASDSTNKFAVKSNAALVAALETGSGGTGDIRAVVSKQAAGNTASFLFQDDFSGRAEIGLCGDDNFHFKVSPDGSSWTDALAIDRTTGALTAGGAPVATVTSGTWTPAYTPASGSFSTITYSPITAGKWTMIGSLVHFSFQIRTTSLVVGTASGVLSITGFPFRSTANQVWWTSSEQFTNNPSEVDYSAGSAALIPSSSIAALKVSDMATGSGNTNTLGVSGVFSLN